MAEQFIEYNYVPDFIVTNGSPTGIIVYIFSNDLVNFPRFEREYSIATFTQESAVESAKFQMDNFGDTVNGIVYPKSNPAQTFTSDLSQEEIDKEGALIEEQNAQQQEETKNEIQNQTVGIDVDSIKNATPEDVKEKGIEKFGKLILLSGLKFANRLTPRVEKEIKDKFSSPECVSQEELDKALRLRENMVGQANQIASTLDAFTKTVLGVSKFLTIAIVIVKGIKTAKAILAGVGAGLSANPVPNPVINQILGAINTVITTIDEVVNNVVFNAEGDSRLIKAKTGVDSAAIAISLANGFIANFVSKLNELDNKLSACDPSAILSPLDSQLSLIAELEKQAKESSNQIGYKGFIIEIEEVPFTPTVNRKKAVGLNKDGIKLIETQPSFTSQDSILRQELKLIIDRDNLKAY